MMLTSILLLLALIHFYWALGGEYGLDKALPTDAKGNRLLNPSVFMTYVVGVVLLGFSYVAYQLYLGDTSLWIHRIGWVLAVLFLLRVLGDFKMVGLFKKVKNTEFAKYDTLLYVPLCFLISCLFIVTLI